jgi:hypothetical protein
MKLNRQQQRTRRPPAANRANAGRLRREPEITAVRMLAFADRFAPGMAPGSTSAAHADLLYNEDGLPR